MIALNGAKWKELIKNSSWAISGALLSKGLLFFVWVIVGRILGSENYGEFGVIRNTVLMFATFSGFGLGLTATKYISEFINIDKQKVVTTINITYLFGLAMGIVVSSFFYLYAKELSNTLNAPHLLNDLRICSVILLCSSFNGVQIGVLQGFKKFREIAKVNIIQSIVSTPIYIIGAIYYDVIGAVAAFLLSYILICVFSSIYLYKVFKEYKVKFGLGYIREGVSIIISYSLPAFLSGILVTPVKWVCDAILINEAGFKSMGIFTAALTFNNIVMVMSSVISGPLLTTLANSKGEKSQDINIERFNLLFPWYLSIFVSLPLIFFSEIGHKMFGDTYDGSEFQSTFIVVLFFTIIMMFKEGFSRIIAVHNLLWWSFASNLVWAGTLILIVILYKNIDSSSMAIAYSIAYMVNILMLFPLYKMKGLIPKKSILTVDTIIVWVIIMLSVIYSYVNPHDLPIRLLVFIVVFILILIIIYKKIVGIKNETN